VKKAHADNHQPRAAKEVQVLLALGFLFLLGSNCFLAGLASTRPSLREGPVRQQQKQ